jgi:hypothetical protein
MDQVKATLTKSSREMSSQMKADMNETRQVLALMRDDFGVGIPRELRKVVASSELARTAILGLSTAFFGLAFINIGVEVFKKIYDHISASSEAAKKEAEATRQVFEAAQNAVEATKQRAEALELIGKGEEERHAIQKKYFDDEIKQDAMRLAAKRAQLAIDLAAVNLSLQEDIYDPGTGAAVGKTGKDAGDDAMRNTLLKQYNEENKETLKQVDELIKKIDEATKASKQSDDTLFVYEQGLAVSRIKNWEKVADAQTAQQKDAIEKMQAAAEISIDQELISLRTAATEKYNIQLKALQDTLNILEQDPSRNKEKIEALQADAKVLWINYEKDLTDIHAQGVAQRKQQTADEARALTEAFKEIAAQTKGQGSNGLGGLIGSLQPNGLPGLGGTKGDFIAAQVERLASTYKDAAAANKFLTQAMQESLTPAEQFKLKSAEINAVWAQLKSNSPTHSVPADVVAALTRELLLANPEFQKLKEASTEFGKDLASELNAAVFATKSWHDALTDILKDLAQIILKYEVLQPLEKLFAGGSSGTGGFLGIFAGLFGGGHAYGGRPSSDQVSLVGENGPELFVPDSSGSIVPNGGFGGVTIYNTVDARGSAPGMELKMQRALQAAMAQSVQSSVAATIERSRRS